MDRSRVVKDSSEILDVISDGGVGIIPLDVAYAIVGNSEKAIKTIFKAKNRLIKSVSQFSALKCVAKHTIKDSNNVMVKLFRRKIIENQNFRLKAICMLKSSSIKYKQVPWAIFKVSNVDYKEYY